MSSSPPHSARQPMSWRFLQGMVLCIFLAIVFFFIWQNIARTF